MQPIVEKTMCEVCEEKESVCIDSYSQPACEECTRMLLVQCLEETCESRTEADYGWKVGNQLPNQEYCQYCRVNIDKREAFDALVEKVEAILNASEWSWSLESIAQTGSMYYEVYRTDDEKNLRADFKIRIADHGSAYCTEDVSLVSDNPTPNDHSIETLERWLANPDWEDC